MNKKVKIIYAEDKTQFRKVIIDDLAYRNIETVFEANNGQELIDNINIEHDIVLLDLAMPVMDGNEAMDYLMEHHPNTKIIIVSLFCNELLFEDYKSRGAKGYISKDVFSSNFNTLIDAIRTVSSGGEYFYAKPENAIKPKYSTVQKEIIPMICHGLTNTEIAKETGKQVRAIEKQRHNIYQKIGGERAIDFYKYAFSIGLQFLKKINWTK